MFMWIYTDSEEWFGILRILKTILTTLQSFKNVQNFQNIEILQYVQNYVPSSISIDRFRMYGYV